MKKNKYDNRIPPSDDIFNILEGADTKAIQWLRSLAEPGPIDQITTNLVYTVDNFYDHLMFNSANPHFAHGCIREYISGLSWILRYTYKIPNDSITDKQTLHRRLKSYENTVFESGINYGKWRDLLLSTQKGGYKVIICSPNEFSFIDPPTWPGIRDNANILLTHVIQGKKVESTIKNRILYEDEHYPWGLKCNKITAEKFHVLWQKLVNIIITWFKKYNSKGIISPPFIISNIGFIDLLKNHTSLTNDEVVSFRELITFNSSTPNKFFLFHKPAIAINRHTLAISRTALIIARKSMIVRRLFAHYDKASFDAWSNEAETNLISRIVNHLENNFIKHQENRPIPGKLINGELDIVWFDENKSTIIIAEVKNITAPDSVIEVESANEVIVKGIDQLTKINNAISSTSLQEFAVKIFGKECHPQHVEFILIPVSFIGSDFLKIPEFITSIPAEYLLLPEQKGKNIVILIEEFRCLWDDLLKTAKQQKPSELHRNTCGPISYTAPGMIFEDRVN